MEYIVIKSLYVTSLFVIFSSVVKYNMTKEEIQYFDDKFAKERKYTDKKFKDIDDKFSEQRKYFDDKFVKERGYSDKRFKDIDDKFSEQRKYFEKKFKNIDKRFEKIEKRLDDIEERLDIVDKKFDIIEKKFQEVDKRFDKLENYLTTRFLETDSKIGEVLEEVNFMRKLGELHTVKIGRLETNYKSRN
jgi:peptidoglycan hydrolase CwlO-like protein